MHIECYRNIKCYAYRVLQAYIEFYAEVLSTGPPIFDVQEQGSICICA